MKSIGFVTLALLTLSCQKPSAVTQTGTSAGDTLGTTAGEGDTPATDGIPVDGSGDADVGVDSTTATDSAVD